MQHHFQVVFTRTMHGCKLQGAMIRKKKTKKDRNSIHFKSRRFGLVVTIICFILAIGKFYRFNTAVCTKFLQEPVRVAGWSSVLTLALPSGLKQQHISKLGKT